MTTPKNIQNRFSAIQSLPPSKIRMLKINRNFIFCMGVLLVFVGIVVFGVMKQGHSPVAFGIISVVLGIAVLWLSVLLFGTVQLTAEKLVSLNMVKRSAGVDDIEKLDIVRSYFGRQTVLVPVVVRKNGKSFPLRPLTWRDRVTTQNPDWTPQKQAEIIHGIRDSIGVDGQDAMI